jgi:hypothetical protein
MQKKHIFKKPKPGNVHLHDASVRARVNLTKAGYVLAEKLSTLLGGTDVKPLVTACKERPGDYRLLFDVPLGTRLPEGVDTFPVKEGSEKLRIKTYPIEALSEAAHERVMKFGMFLVGAKFVSSRKGQSIRIRFGGTEEQIGVIRKELISAKLETREVGLPKRGEAKPGLYLVVPIQKSVVKKSVSTRVSVKRGKVKSFGFEPESVYQMLWAGFQALPLEYQKRFVASVLGRTPLEELMLIIQESSPHGVSEEDVRNLIRQVDTSVPSVGDLSERKN